MLVKLYFLLRYCKETEDMGRLPAERLQRERAAFVRDRVQRETRPAVD